MRIKEILNLGVFSRVLLVIVKPLCLLLALRFDADAGVGLAQVFLLGVLVVSFVGSNAHKRFYEIQFSTEGASEYSVQRYYFRYLHILIRQLLLIVVILSLLLLLFFNGSVAVICAGIAFGLGEKINDEYQRYAQFCNDSIKLLMLAISKSIAALIAILTSYFGVIDTYLPFSLLILLGAVAVSYKGVASSFKSLKKSVRVSLASTLRASFRYLKSDASQIVWVFTSMTLMSIDKWLVQYIDSEALPAYMLMFQIAATAIVFQTIFLVAPVRVRLIKENPWDIKSIKIGSPIISFLTAAVGLFAYLYQGHIPGDPANGYFAFFIAAIFVYSVPYSERIYWVISSNNRMLTDIVFIIGYIIAISLYANFIKVEDILTECLAMLSVMLLFRFIFLRYLLLNVKG